MDTPDLKLLKQLAAACRKAGISSYEGYGYKFTLSDSSPPTRKPRSAKSSSAAPKDLGENVPESDELSPQALMFWSIGSDPETSPEGTQ